MYINPQELKIDENLGLTKEDIQKDLSKAMKRIYINSIPVADVVADDYFQYKNVTGEEPDHALKKIIEKDMDRGRELYPGRDDLDIAGFLFSEKFYKAVKKRHKLNKK